MFQTNRKALRQPQSRERLGHIPRGVQALRMPTDETPDDSSEPQEVSSSSRSMPACDDVPPGVWRIHGRDYDLSSWVDEHPGGPMMILLGKGTDCTILFETYHMFNEPRKRLREHDVTPDGRKPEVIPCPSPFLRDVRAMVKEHFKDAKLSPKRVGRVERWAHKATIGQLLLLFLLLLLEFASTFWWIAFGSIGAGIVAGFCGYLLMVNLGHDASHGALTRYPWMNTLGHFLGNAPYVNGHVSWSLQHIISHHQHTNEVGFDVDSHHFPFARWHRLVDPEINGGAWLGGLHNSFWHLITYLGATVSMCLIHPVHFVFVPLVCVVCFGSLPKSFRGGLPNATPPRHGILGCPQPSFDSAFEKVAGTFARERVLLHHPLWLVGNIFIWCVSLALLLTPLVLTAIGGGAADGETPALDVYPYRPHRVPQAASSVATAAEAAHEQQPPAQEEDPYATVIRWTYAVFLALAPWAMSSIAFMTATQISHIQEVCQKESTLNEPCPYKRQALTSLDHSTTSILGHFLTGGLNLQSVHHCMPSISLVHYPAIYPRFREVCKKHQCLSMDAGSLPQAIYSHWHYIYRLGRGDNPSGVEPLKPAQDADMETGKAPSAERQTPNAKPTSADPETARTSRCESRSDTVTKLPAGSTTSSRAYRELSPDGSPKTPQQHPIAV